MIRALAFVLLAASASAEPLRIGAEPDYRPYMQRDAAGNWTGFDRQLGDEICVRGGYDCEWVLMPFDALIPAIVAGEIDIAIAGMANAPSRARVVDFTQPYRPDSPNYGAFAALVPALTVEGMLTGVQTGTVHADYLEQVGQPFRAYPDTARLLEALRSGDVQVIFGSLGALEDMTETTDPDLRIVATLELPNYATAIAVTKDRPDLRARLDEILETLDAEGVLDALEQRWFPEGVAL
jgi:polar amino acid transport system substrate-binding protein